MKETPIIMSGNHPKLILDDLKTMTRRVIKPELKVLIHDFDNAFADGSGYKLHVPVRHPTEPDFSDHRITRIYCPYGQVGSRLWVRETWAKPIERYADVKGAFVYKAGYEKSMGERFFGIPFKWKSSIFMPRWASRITLEITEVRVERLQEISPNDCNAEGLPPIISANIAVGDVSGFAYLWDSLNAKRGYGWEVNLWVWVISFRRI